MRKYECRVLIKYNRIAPYTLDVKEVPWWSIYEIGQRLTTAFDNSQNEEGPRVFSAAMLAIPTVQRLGRASIRRSWIHGTLEGNWRMSKWTAHLRRSSRPTPQSGLTLPKS